MGVFLWATTRLQKSSNFYVLSSIPKSDFACNTRNPTKSGSMKTLIFTQNKRSRGRQSTASCSVCWIIMAYEGWLHIQEEVSYLLSYLFSYQVSKSLPRSLQRHSLAHWLRNVLPAIFRAKRHEEFVLKIFNINKRERLRMGLGFVLSEWVSSISHLSLRLSLMTWFKYAVLHLNLHTTMIHKDKVLASWQYLYMVFLWLYIWVISLGAGNRF